MGGPASRFRYNEFSIRMAHRQYYLFHNSLGSFGFKILLKFYMEGKISKWLEDESQQWEREIKYIKLRTGPKFGELPGNFLILKLSKIPQKGKLRRFNAGNK